MSDMDRSFSGSMPEFYDRILVPVMFEPFAQDLAERFAGMKSGHVLEIAAGTGVVTRALARKLPAAVERNRSDPDDDFVAVRIAQADLADRQLVGQRRIDDYGTDLLRHEHSLRSRLRE